jgi:hypothetical protein
MSKRSNSWLFSGIMLLNFLFLTEIHPVENKIAEKQWAIDLVQKDNDQKSSGIELMHAEEGKYLGAQKSKEGILIFHGGTKVKINNYILLADTIKINPETGELLGEGGVTLTDGFQIIKGTRFFYNNTLRVGVLYDVDGFLKPLYVMGNYAKITSIDNLVISAAFLSTCEAETPHYYLKAKKIWLRSDNQFVAIGIIYYIGQAPIFYLPFIVQTDLGTGIYTLLGYNSSQGFYLQNSYFYGFSKNSYLLPANATLMFDYYQFDGLYAGTYINKRSENLNYDITLGIASRVTRFEIFPTGAISNLNQTWHEINAFINPRWHSDSDKDSQSALNVNFESYSHPTFDQIFKQRYIPDNTINAIAINRTLYSPAARKDSILWKGVYSENWQDNSLVVTIENKQTWNNYKKGFQYYPDYETFPSLLFKKNWYIVKPTGKYFQGITNNIDLGTGISHQYSLGELFHTINYLDARSGINAFFPLHNLIMFQPGIGYGIKGQFYNSESVTDKLENEKKSYQYLYTLDKLFLGPSYFKSTLSYAFQWATVETITDPYFKQERENKIYLTLSSDFAPFGYLSLGSARDLRKFPGIFVEKNQWDPLFITTIFDYDFINHDNIFLPEIYTPNTYFLGIGTSESFYYNIMFDSPGINSLSLYLQSGGYRFFLLDRVEKVKIGFNWVHDFLNYNRNRVLLFLETRVDLLKYWRIDLSVNTTVYNTGTSESPYQYVGETLGSIFTSDNTNSPFELNEFKVIIEHDLHDWVMQLSYSVKQSWISYGIQGQNYAGYYEHGVYITFTLKGFKGLGLSNTQLSRFNPRENPDTYGLR